MPFRLIMRGVLFLSFLSCASQKPLQVKKPKVAPQPVGVVIDSSLLAVDEKVEKDETVESIIAPLRSEMQAYTQRVVGSLQAPLTRGKPESTMGNFVTDAMMSHIKRTTGVEPDFCFTNLGGLRVDLPAGEITAGQVTELMPFDNTIVLFKTTGKQTEDLLMRLVQRGDPVSGLRYRLPGVDFEIAQKPYDRNASYTVCTNDYLFNGGGNYPIHPETRATYTGELLRDAIQETFVHYGMVPVVKKDNRVLPALPTEQP